MIFQPIQLKYRVMVFRFNWDKTVLNYPVERIYFKFNRRYITAANETPISETHLKIYHTFISAN